jgi:glycosyltransferase involved in cell wall biosynthesis
LLVVKKSQSTKIFEFQPLVSVIMNCHNGEYFLREAIDSVIGQSYQNWEIIFWDNQSIDGSAEIFKSYSDNRLRYYYASSHTLLYEARNHAIDRSQGEFIAFLDVDDKWDSRKLERQIPLFNNPRVGVVYSNYFILSDKLSRIAHNYILPEGMVTNVLLGNYCVGLVTIIVRKGAFNKSGKPLCNPQYHIIGDFDFIIRLSVEWEFLCIQQPLASYRYHGNNESSIKIKLHILELQNWIIKNKKNYTIDKYSNFNKLIQIVWYLEGVNMINERNYALVFLHLLKSAPFLMKIKILGMIILPKGILVHFKP